MTNRIQKLPAEVVELMTQKARTVADYHKIGTALIDVSTDDGDFPVGLAGEIVKETRLNRAVLTACRKFARIYTQNEAKGLDRITTWQHIFVTLPIKSKDARLKLLTLARTRRMSSSTLRSYISSRTKKTRCRGFKRKSIDLATDVFENSAIVDALLHSVVSIMGKNSNGYVEELADFPNEEREAMVKAMRTQALGAEYAAKRLSELADQLERSSV